MISNWIQSLALTTSMLFSPLNFIEFQAVLKNSIGSAQEVTFLGEPFFYGDGKYSGPPSSLVPLMDFVIRPPLLNFEQHLCLLFKSPMKDGTGELIFVEIPVKQDCQKVWPSWSDVRLTKVIQLQLSKLTTSYYQLKIQLSQGEQLDWKLEFPNTKGRSSVPQRYSTYAYARGQKGRPMSWPIMKSFVASNAKKPTLISPWRCRDFNQAGEMTTNNCSQCSWSVLPVFNAGRQTKLAYDCTPSSCGERSQAACLIGAAHLLDWDQVDICADTNEVATCRDGKPPTCSKNGDILCP